MDFLSSNTVHSSAGPTTQPSEQLKEQSKEQSLKEKSLRASSKMSAKPFPHSEPFEVVGIDALLSRPGGVALPPIGSEAAISQRHEVNSAIALNLLNDIHTAIVAWQAHLRQVVQALHTLSAQGPMVEGWLESSLPSPDQGAASAESATVLRHGDTDALMRYIEALADTAALDQPIQAQIGLIAEVADSPQPDYRLCRLDANGKVRSQPCPAAQMAAVSRAIARHQKFKQLTLRKQAIETKLQKAVDQLTSVRAGIQTD
ncbi:MAG: hypothetical protein WA885_25360 [Phormidesmis sp.]